MSEMALSLSFMSMILGSFLIFNHPLLLVMLLVALTLVIMMNLLFLFNSSWMTMILFLIFLGGLLVIFSYLSMLVPNELEKKQIQWSVFFMSPLLLPLIYMNQWHLNLMKSLTLTNSLNEMSFILFLLIYLLTVLAASMVITQNLKGPLHQESY